MADLISTAPPAPSEVPNLGDGLRKMFRRVMAGNPFYLASAGLLLYGINQLTTDTKLIGAELPMLKFNFCALLIYEIILVVTAIALARRKIWYDALLLFGLANLFIIVPFSLISRAVFLSSNLAMIMSFSGTVLAVAKFWSFKKYVPELNLPRRLLLFGAFILLANALAPLLFKRIADHPMLIQKWLVIFWVGAMPLFAALANFLPRQSNVGNAPGQHKCLPPLIFLAWLLVTACHFGGIGYSNTFNWSLSLLVPSAWVVAWTLHFRISDFVGRLKPILRELLLSVPLLIALLAIDSPWMLPLFATLNLICYGLRFAFKERTFFHLTRFLGAGTIFLAGLPMGWVSFIEPAAARSDWVLLSVVVSFFWLIFLSRDPRAGMLAAVSLCALCFYFAPPFSLYAVQVALVSLLAHSLRWNDRAHRGAALLRNLVGMLWVAMFWLGEPDPRARLLVVSTAVVLMVIYTLRGLLVASWQSRMVSVYPAIILIKAPTVVLTHSLANESPGIIAIGGSFLLFGVGSIAAFSKPKG